MKNDCHLFKKWVFGSFDVSKNWHWYWHSQHMFNVWVWAEERRGQGKGRVCGANISKQSLQSKNGNTILHILAQSPTSETSLDLIMDLLQFGFNPSLKNKKGQNFLDVSTIKDHLLQRIRSAPDNWTYGLMSNWIHNSRGE